MAMKRKLLSIALLTGGAVYAGSISDYALGNSSVDPTITYDTLLQSGDWGWDTETNQANDLLGYDFDGYEEWTPVRTVWVMPEGVVADVAPVPEPETMGVLLVLLALGVIVYASHK